MRPMKVTANGRQIEGLSAPAVLRHDDTPKKVVQALDAWADARDRLSAAAQAHREAEAAARERTLQVRGERERYNAEIREATKEEHAALRRAERETSAAASALVAALTEHGDAVDAVAARLALEAHAVRVDALVEAGEAHARERSALAGLVLPHHPLVPAYEPMRLPGIRGSAERTPLEEVDVVNTHALAEIAGDRCGLVEAVSRRDFARVLTTPRRAAALVAHGGHGRQDWFLAADDQEAVA